MDEAVRVFIVEDDVPMRRDFEEMIASHPALSFCGSAGTVAEAKYLLALAPVDVALVDLGLPDGDGAEIIEYLAVSSPATLVLVSTVFGDEAHVVRALEAGARGYLLKDTTADELVRSIMLVRAGDVPLSPQIAKYVLKRFATARSGDAAHESESIAALTPREIDVLKAVAHGLSVKEMARHLGLSSHTVSTHMKNIYGKLAVRSRVGALNQARSKGFIS
jgi:DNA-binding NarL/FixJ family response regulator